MGFIDRVLCPRKGLKGVLFAFFIAFSGVAQSADDYFQATVPVKNQSSSTRQSAAKLALQQVLFRISGTSAVKDAAGLRGNLAKAISYVDQFQYAPTTDAQLNEQGYTQLVSMRFSPSAVRKMLVDAELPFWSVNRPSTLVWIVEDSAEFGRQLVNEQSESPVLAGIKSAAAERGLPLRYPILDLDDQLSMSVDDVWELNEAAITKASARYRADVIMVGRYSTTSRGEVWATWQFFHAGATRSHDSRVNLENDTAITELGVDALYPLADFLAERYAIVPKLEIGGSLVVQIEGVRDFGDYRRSMNYLEGLAAISSVTLASVNRGEMMLYLDSKSSVERLIGALALDNKLVPLNDTQTDVPVWQQAPPGTLENPLKFSWSS